MTGSLRPAFESGAADSSRGRATWAVVSVLLVASLVSFGLTMSMVGDGGQGGATLREAPVADGPWRLQWSGTAETPSREQARQLHALRRVAGGAAGLLSLLSLLVAWLLLRQRFRLRRPEYLVHWALGARRIHFAARLAGEGWSWALGVGTLGIGLTMLAPIAIEHTFPGESSVPPNIAAAIVFLTGFGVVLLRWECRVGEHGLRPVLGHLFQQSSTAIVALGFAVLTAVGLLATHSPGTPSPDRVERVIIGASLASLPFGSRAPVVDMWQAAINTASSMAGFASAGASRGVGYREEVWVECGRCFEGGLPLPVRPVRAEIQAVAADTFGHLGLAMSRGRDFDNDLDRGAASVAIVSQALANRHFERGEAIGRRVRFGDSAWLTVIGVVGDRGDRGYVRDQRAYNVYVPLTQVEPTEIELLVDVSLGDLEATMSLVPPGVTLRSPRTTSQLFAVFGWFVAFLKGLGATALALVGAGVWISARNEATEAEFALALRKAVGARRRDLRMFALSLTCHRLVIALALGAWLSLFLGAVLHEAYGAIPQADASVWGTVAILLSVTYVLGSWPSMARAANRAPLIGLNMAP